ncbi:hypothetical protein MBANPS3_004255 [Mucor bainieri]
MSSSCQRFFIDGQRLLSDVQRILTDASSSTNGLCIQPTMNASTSISQVMGDIGVPREFSGFPATNILETPDTYELQAEVPGVDKNSIKIEAPDSHTLTILGKVQDETVPVKKEEDKMEEDAVSPVAAEAQTDTPQPQDDQGSSAESGNKPAWWTNERVLGSFGSFRRSFFFLDPVTVEGATATIKAGVIKIVLSKAKEVKSDIKLIQLED